MKFTSEMPQRVLQAHIALRVPTGHVRDPHHFMYIVMTGHLERLELRDRAMGIVEHDRILTGRAEL